MVSLTDGATCGSMYEFYLAAALEKVRNRDRVRRENHLPALDTRAESFSVFSNAVISQWESACREREALREFIVQAVAAELGRPPKDQRVQISARVLFSREMEQRFDQPIPKDKLLQAIFDRWWEARHAV